MLQTTIVPYAYELYLLYKNSYAVWGRQNEFYLINISVSNITNCREIETIYKSCQNKNEPNNSTHGKHSFGLIHSFIEGC